MADARRLADAGRRRRACPARHTFGRVEWPVCPRARSRGRIRSHSAPDPSPVTRPFGPTARGLADPRTIVVRSRTTISSPGTVVDEFDASSQCPHGAVTAPNVTSGLPNQREVPRHVHVPAIPRPHEGHPRGPADSGARRIRVRIDPDFSREPDHALCRDESHRDCGSHQSGDVRAGREGRVRGGTVRLSPTRCPLPQLPGHAAGPCC